MSRLRHLIRRLGLPRLLMPAVLLLAFLQPAFGQGGPLTLTAVPGAGGTTQYSVPVQTLLFLTALGFCRRCCC